MTNIGKAMGGNGGFTTDSQTSKINVREYEDMSIKVGFPLKLRKQTVAGLNNSCCSSVYYQSPNGSGP